MYSPKILMAQQFDKIAKFCEYANISYKDFFHIINTKIAGGNFYNYKTIKAHQSYAEAELSENELLEIVKKDVTQLYGKDFLKKKL